MTDLMPSDRPSSIYIVGVPAAGKTILVTALARRLETAESRYNFHVVSEVARELIVRERVLPSEIQDGEVYAMNLQQRILEEQAMRERTAINTADFIVSDRSGVDPIVFALYYGGQAFGQEMLKSQAWKFVRVRMQLGLVILCEPRQQWFVEDGVRVTPASSTETTDLHELFSEVLRAQAIPFEILSASLTDVQDRVRTVMRCWESTTSGNFSQVSARYRN